MIRHALRTFVALLRVELRGIAPASLGLAVCVVLGFGYARFAGGFVAPLDSQAWFGALSFAAAAIAIPIVALPFDGASRGAFTGTLRPLPVGRAAETFGKVAAGFVAVAFAAAVIAACDAVLAAVAPEQDAGRTTLFFADAGHRSALLLWTVPAIAVSLLAAMVLESALAATILGVATLALPALAAGGAIAESPLHTLGQLSWNVGVSPGEFMIAQSFVLVAPAFVARTLRGRRGRSVLRRAGLAAAVGLGLTLTTAGLAEARAARVGAPVAWDDPGTRLARVDCPAGAPYALVQLWNHDRERPEYGFWALDRSTLEARRIEPPALGPRILGRDFQIDAESAYDGQWLGAMYGSPLLSRRAGVEYRVQETDGSWSPVESDAWRAERTWGSWVAFPGAEGSGAELRWCAGRSRGAASLSVEVPEGFTPYGNGAQRLSSELPLFLRSAEGELHRFDRVSGEVVGLGIPVPEEVGRCDLSPEGRWMTVALGRQEFVLLEVATGRHRVLPHEQRGWLTDRERPVLRRVAGRGWLQIGLDGERELGVEPTSQVWDLDGERWLERTHPDGELWVLDRDGRRLERLR